MEDKRGILKKEQPFSYREIRDNRVQITFRGRLIKTIHGKDYNRFLRILDSEDSYQIQLFLAKITGQFKMGNEKAIKG